MLKSSILNYNSFTKGSMTSGWKAMWIVILTAMPLGLFAVMLLFEKEIAGTIHDLFPPTKVQGMAFYLDIVYLARTEILWLGFFFLMVFLLATYLRDESIANAFHFRVKSRAVFYMMLIASVFFFTTVLVSVDVLERFPNSSDEYAYLFQAEMFSRGKLWEAAHDLPGFFYNNNITQFDGILVSRFPPGWPLILSEAFAVGMDPALVNPLLGLLTLVVFYFFAKKFYGVEVAVWSMLAVAFTGFFVFNSASFFSHTSCVLMTLLFVLSIRMYLEKGNFLYGLLAGAFIAFIVLIRYYTAVLIFVPFLGYLIVHHRFRIIRLFLLMGVGAAPAMAYLLWYNYSITGNALTPVTVWAYPKEKLGFVKGHSFLKGIEHWVRWLLMFLYWSSPGLLILYFVYIWRKIKKPVERFVRPEDYTFLMLFVGYFFYYQIGGNQYGPRFLFESFPFLVLFVVSKVMQTRERWATAVLIASLVYAVVKFPFITSREERIVDQRQDLYDLVEEEKISNAVVLVSSPTSPIRPMPADDLTRNDSRFADDVIYALEIPSINDQLLKFYPDRSFYRYVRDLNKPHGELIRIR